MEIFSVMVNDVKAGVSKPMAAFRTHEEAEQAIDGTIDALKKTAAYGTVVTKLSSDYAALFMGREIVYTVSIASCLMF